MCPGDNNRSDHFLKVERAIPPVEAALLAVRQNHHAQTERATKRAARRELEEAKTRAREERATKAREREEAKARTKEKRARAKQLAVFSRVGPREGGARWSKNLTTEEMLQRAPCGGGDSGSSLG